MSKLEGFGEFNLIDVMESNESLTGDGFIDRSKVRILLCDNDLNGSGEVFTLLCKCSYQGIYIKFFTMVLFIFVSVFMLII